MLHRSHVILSLILGMGVSARSVDAKSLGVDLQSELHSARVVMLARIVAYDPDRLRFQPIQGSASSLSARHSTDPTWNPTRFIRDPWPGDATSTMTAEWPPVGAEVLVVVNSEDVVSLFAHRAGEAYRFWAPLMTGSTALFFCRPPAQPLPGKELRREDAGSDANPASWDGCLMPVSAVAVKTTMGASSPTRRSIPPPREPRLSRRGRMGTAVLAKREVNGTPPVWVGGSMKGWELYSWQAKTGEWYFTLCPGTNGLKSIREILSSGILFEELKTQLSQLPAGEPVFWESAAWFQQTHLDRRDPGFRQPPAETVSVVKGICAKRELQLRIIP